ncbi:entericidin A/B family lipoprotein [Methyloparacoccus murrellii]
MKYGALTLMLATSLLLSGCNTWSGFGQDLQKVGQKVQQQGDKVKH